jgi:hypothetical protein
MDDVSLEQILSLTLEPASGAGAMPQLVWAQYHIVGEGYEERELMVRVTNGFLPGAPQYDVSAVRTLAREEAEQLVAFLQSYLERV